MIDWVKLCLINKQDIEQLLQSDIVPFTSTCSEKTGELFQFPKKGTYKCFEFVLRSPEYLLITGSMHKYHTGGFNNSDFNFYALNQAIDQFCAEIGVNAAHLQIQNIEFGINVETPISATEIIEDVICYKNRLPANPINDNKGYYTQYKLNDYIVKLYDKAKQYHMKTPLLRWEFKAVKQRFVADCGVQFLSDLKDIGNVQALAAKLIACFENLVFDDSSIIPQQLTKREMRLYEKWQNPKIWAKLKGGKKSADYANARRFKGIVSKHGKYAHFDSLKALIVGKCRELTTEVKSVGFHT